MYKKLRMNLQVPKKIILSFIKKNKRNIKKILSIGVKIRELEGMI